MGTDNLLEFDIKILLFCQFDSGFGLEENRVRAIRFFLYI